MSGDDGNENEKVAPKAAQQNCFQELWPLERNAVEFIPIADQKNYLPTNSFRPITKSSYV